MKASSPINNPATTPAIVQMTVPVNLAGKKYRDLGSVKGGRGAARRSYGKARQTLDALDEQAAAA